MKTHRYKQCLALLLSLVLLALCAGGALAVGPSAKTSVSGYALQRNETSSGGMTLTYQGAGGQMSVYYSAEAKAAQRQDGVTRQFSGEALLYDCYGKDFDSNSIGTVYYTVGACTVEVRSVGGRADKDAMLAFLEGIQASPIPVATGVCPQCGGDLYCHGAQVGAWMEGSSSVCGHGGTVKYRDTQNTRNVCVTSVCAACGHEVEDAYTQDAVYCSYGNRWVS